MFSDNIITRDHALSELLSFNPMNSYFVGVIILAVICWRIAKWI